MSDSIPKPLIRKRLPLNELLQFASLGELTAIVDILAGDNNERIFHYEEGRENLLNHRKNGTLSSVTDLIAKEICFFGSSTIASVFRKGEPVSYEEVVRDVASELKVIFPKQAEVAEIEEKILIALLAKVIDGKSEDEIKEILRSGDCTIDSGVIESIRNANDVSALATFLSAHLGQFQLAKLMGRDTSFFLKGAAVASLVSARAIPAIGAFTLVKAAYERSSPSLSVIIPAVVRIAFIRQRLIKADFDKFFMELRACL